MDLTPKDSENTIVSEPELTHTHTHTHTHRHVHILLTDTQECCYHVMSLGQWLFEEKVAVLPGQGLKRNRDLRAKC